jgi:regulatory protein
MIITKISPQVKREGYYNIYINDKYELSLSELDLAAFQLKTNQSIDEKKLEELKRAQSKSKSYNFAIRYLALRPRSVKEVRDYLVVRKGFSEDDARLAIDRLLSEKYLNDQDFAEMWVRNRILLSPKSNKILRLELIKKGVDSSTIDLILSSIDRDQQLEILNNLIEKKTRQSRYQNKQKLTEYLSRQGFTYDLIKQALESLTFLED